MTTRLITTVFILERNLADFLTTHISQVPELSMWTYHALLSAGILGVYQLPELNEEQLAEPAPRALNMSGEIGKYIGRRGLRLNSRLTREAKILLGVPIADDDPHEAVSGQEIADGPFKRFEQAIRLLPGDHPNRDTLFANLNEFKRLLTS